jgi:hypothetical protein
MNVIHGGTYTYRLPSSVSGYLTGSFSLA